MTDKNSDQYKIVLKFINQVLVNIGKKEIDDLTKFVDISRNDIIKDCNKHLLENMEKEIFALFDKTKCGWYRRKTTQNYILTFLRYICTCLGLTFTYHELKKQENNIVVSTTLYSIKANI